MRRIAICISAAATLAFASLAHATTIFQISGGGFGHGIGMSQYGAYGYALHGADYKSILAHYYQGTAVGNEHPNRTVRVLLASGSARFSGAARLMNEASGRTRKLSPAATYSVRVLVSGALALYNSAGRKLAAWSAPLLVSGPSPLTLAARGTYRGALELRALGGIVETINVVGLDDYVRGVVAAEMPSSWASAALEAQAVAARTYAVTSDVNGSVYQLYPDTRSQMYGGVGAETAATDAAVAATRGQILTYQGAPAAAFFFSSSGGYTENVENVWPGATPEPWLRGVPDPYDNVAGNPYFHWTFRMPLASATRKLGSLVRGRFRGIRVTKRGVSPRVLDAVIVGSRGTRRVTGAQLEQLFGLPSTYMRFTTISSRRVRRLPPLRDAVDRIYPAALRAVLKNQPPVLAGSVFPAGKRALVTLERRARRGWRTVRRLHVAAGGGYSVALGAGTYRVLYGGVAGPTVTVG